MKITFTFWQVIGILVLIYTSYLLFPWFYHVWMFPEYRESGIMTNDTFIVRTLSIIFSICMLIIYLGPMNGVKHLNKKRSITLKNPFKN